MTSHEAIEERAQRLLKVTQQFCDAYGDMKPSVSIGISTFREDGETLTDLYVRADEALYRAKKNGKNQAVFASEK